MTVDFPAQSKETSIKQIMFTKPSWLFKKKNYGKSVFLIYRLRCPLACYVMVTLSFKLPLFPWFCRLNFFFFKGGQFRTVNGSRTFSRVQEKLCTIICTSAPTPPPPPQSSLLLATREQQLIWSSTILYHILDFYQSKRWIKGAFPLLFSLCLKPDNKTSSYVMGRPRYGKTTTLILRWDSDNMAAIARPDQSESVTCKVSQKVTKRTETWRSAALLQANSNCSPKGNQSNKVRTTFLLHKLLTQTLLCLKAQLHSQTHPQRSTMTVRTIAKKCRKNMW